MSDATNTEADAVEAVPEPERLHGALVTDSYGQVVLHPTREQYVARRSPTTATRCAPTSPASTTSAT
jgi:hypothetical protein